MRSRFAAAVTTLGFAFAYGIRFKAGRWGQLCVFVTLITLFGGYLAKIYAWKTILGNEGILNSALIGLGIINQPLSYLLYSPGATALTLGHWLMPLAVLPILASLRGIEDITIESARDLGASPWRMFLDIILPQSLPGLMAAFAFCFLIAAGNFVTPRMVNFDYAIVESARDLGASPLRAFFTVTLPVVRSTVIGAAFIVMAISLDEFIITFFTIGGGNTLPTFVWGMLRTSVDPQINAIATILISLTVGSMAIALKLSRYRG